MPMQDDEFEPQSPRLEELLAVLRRPTRPQDRAGESDAVATMAALVTSTTKGPASVLPRRRTARVVAAAALATMALGGATAVAAVVSQGPQGDENNILPAETTEMTTTGTDLSTPTTTAAPTSTEAPTAAAAPTTEADDAPEVEATEATQPDDVQDEVTEPDDAGEPAETDDVAQQDESDA